MLARTHETSTFALTCTGAVLAGVPPLGCVAVAAWATYWCDWPDIDMPRSRITLITCLFPYPVRHLDTDGKQRWHEKGKREGRLKWQWRTFPGYPIHLFWHWLSTVVYDACATDDDRRDSIRKWGPKFRTHRGLTHSVWFALLFGTAVWFALPIVGDCLHLIGVHPESVRWSGIFGTENVRGLLALSATVGIVGHILGDCCTDYACAPFAPLWRWKGRRYVEMGLWEPMRFKVDHWVEHSIVTWLSNAAVATSVLAAFGWLSPALSALWRLWSVLGGGAA